MPFFGKLICGSALWLPILSAQSVAPLKRRCSCLGCRTLNRAKTGTMYTVITGSTKASKTVSLTYTQGWHAAYDNFTYQTPSTGSGSAGKLTAQPFIAAKSRNTKPREK